MTKVNVLLIDPSELNWLVFLNIQRAQSVHDTWYHQIFRTKRCAIAPIKVARIKYGSTPISMRRVTTPIAVLV